MCYATNIAFCQFVFNNECSDNDPVTSNIPRLVDMLKRIPSTQKITIEVPGRFIQEESGPEYGQLIIDFINGNL